jgi:hypothetical protein
VPDATRRRVIAWDKEDGYGVEYADIALSTDRLTARGLAIGWDPEPYHLEFTLETGPGWVTRRLEVSTRGAGWTRTLDLRRSDSGWHVDASAEGEVDLEPPGGGATAFAEARDCDLGLSPLTNSMPVLRHDLLGKDGSVDLVMAWVAVPALAVRASNQRYTTLGAAAGGLRRIEYRSGTFASQLLFDVDGVCVDYPQLGRVVPWALSLPVRRSGARRSAVSGRPERPDRSPRAPR